MTVDWAKLAIPFDPSDIKERPGAATWDHKPQCQGRGCRETRDATKHLQFSYVDARAVMQRLDDVLTPEGWDFQSSVIPGADIVHGKLTIPRDDPRSWQLIEVEAGPHEYAVFLAFAKGWRWYDANKDTSVGIGLLPQVEGVA